MKIALIGADGKVGTRILAELVSRGHIITAIARHPERVHASKSVTVTQADANDSTHITDLTRGHDAIISALTYKDVNLRNFITAIKQAQVPHLIVVGNAGSLEVQPGVRVMDSPHFPPEHTAQAMAHDELLNMLKADPELHWTVLSPPLYFGPGERTGHFRQGENQLLTDSKGQSKISFEDFAIALVDELEKPRHNRQRFSVAY